MKLLSLCLVLLSTGVPAATGAAPARPDYHEQFLADPLRRADVEGCGVCHQDVAGGGPRNEFGEAFESAGLVITPMMRASFPDRFDVPSASISDRGTIYFSDPDGVNAVVEIDGSRFLIDLPAEALNVAEATDEEDADAEASLPGGPPENFSFFVTSVGLGHGGNLGSIAGADRHCQSLAEAVGAGDHTWHAYLSTSFEDAPAIHAGDRIGSGPWYNIRGIRIARGVADLHSEYSNLDRETALTETGQIPSHHDILTGTRPDGTASDLTCRNWTSTEGRTLVGHFDRTGEGSDGGSWNSAHTTESCSQEDLGESGGDSLFYCFAID